MQAPGQPHNDIRRSIQDVFAAFSKSTLPESIRSRDVPVVTVYDNCTATTRRKSPLFSTWPTLIFVSIILGIIFVFLCSIPSWSNSFWMPYLSDELLDAIKDWITFSRPTSSAFSSSNGRTDQVQWDNYTLILRGQRILI